MTEETLEAHLGRPVTIDLCFTCQAFWFDKRESLQLSPGSTLKLFRVIGEHASDRPAPPSQTARCPRCTAALVATHDLQRTTRFEYRRCPDGHGRLTTFYNFLREKDFIRPLSARQLAELRQHVQTVNCSNCGGPVDVTDRSSCQHCGSALSMLDATQAERLVSTLQQAQTTSQSVDPAWPLELDRARRDVHGAFDLFERDDSWFGDASRSGLVGAGLQSVARWLSKG